MKANEKVLYMFLGAIMLVMGFMTGFALSINVLLGILVTGLYVIPVMCAWYISEDEEG
jgi:uncharacterized membrane protein (Fun14 family)